MSDRQMTDTTTQIALAIHKLAGIIDANATYNIGACIRDAFPLPFVDDGPNGLGGVISPDDAKPDTTSSRDWPEDFSHENGNYVCICSVCKNTFCGHKRRLICKECAKGESAPAAPDALIKKLLNPMFVGREMNRPGEKPVLDPTSTVSTMREAAAEIHRLNNEWLKLQNIRLSSDDYQRAEKAEAVTDKEVRICKALLDSSRAMTCVECERCANLIERLARERDEAQAVVMANFANAASSLHPSVEQLQRRLAKAVQALNPLANQYIGESDKGARYFQEAIVAALSSLKGGA